MTRFIILNFCFFVIISIKAQKIDFSQEWSLIEQLEVDGKVTSALERVNKLYNKAIQKKKETQQLKALLFRWKFTQIIDEKSQITILQEVNEQIKKQQFPNKQLLYMYKAHFLESYLNNNYWRINKRTATESAAIKSYQTWDLNTFLNEITLNYNEALLPYLSLSNVSTEVIKELLVTVPISRKYKPTAYDIIAHKALMFYKNTRNRVNKPKDEFLIDSANYFENSSTFVRNNLNASDKESLLFKALQIYQQLEKIHSNRKNDVAWVGNVLSRLAFVKDNYTGSFSKKLYLKSLQQLQKEFKKSGAVAEIKLKLAQAYRNLASQKEDSNGYSNPSYNQKALDLITEIEKLNTNAKVLIEAKNLKNEILQVKLKWKVQNKFLPNKEHLAQVAFTNASGFTINAYRVPLDFDLNKIEYSKKDSLTHAYLSKRKSYFSKNYVLPVKKDYNKYTTEFIVPKLPLGNYVFRVQTDSIADSYRYHHLRVTQIGINKTIQNKNNQYQVIDRYTGKPLEGAKVRVKIETNRGSKQYQTDYYTTDSWGNFKTPKKERYQNQEIRISTAKDSIIIQDYSYGRNRSYINDQAKVRIKTMLFLDRAIYRPGQEVYFKAIAISEVDKKNAVVSNRKIIIQINNPNNEKVYTEKLILNKYGSINGKFKLPKTGLTGNFRITASLENPINKEKYSNASTSFSVEEYKRPTFEVSFFPATEIYKPLDSIMLKGNVKAFSGTSVTDASVKYSIVRTTYHRGYWWSKSINKESKQIDLGNTITDKEGNFNISFKAEVDEIDTENKIYNYLVKVKVIDLNGETREATEVIKVADRNLMSTITTAKDWTSNKTNNITITTADINGNPINASGKVKIYKLKSPNRFLNNRPWSIPDIQNIDKNLFIKQFPHIPFTNENDSKNWKKGISYFDHTFNNTNKENISIGDSKKWPAGKYLLLVTVTNPKTKASTELQKLITLTHQKQRIPADQQIFEHSVIKEKKKLILNLQTSTKELITFVEVFDGNKSIWKQQVKIEKGTKLIDLQLPKLLYPKVTVSYKYQIFNRFYTSQDVVDFTPKPVVLTINKKHFNDKITPGGKETWSFNIKSSNKKSFNAEVLATMYDASLDQFIRRPWDTNFEFNNYVPKPSTALDLVSLGVNSTNYSRAFNSLYYPSIPKEQVNLFGFDFNVINSWGYRKYLKGLKVRIESYKQNKLNGNKVIIGVVLNNEKVPLPRASIKIEKKNKEVVTNFDGEFSLALEKADIVKVSYPGFKTQIFRYKGKKHFYNIVLEADLFSLNEMEITGNQSVKKHEFIGSTTKLSSKEFKSKSAPMTKSIALNEESIESEDSVEEVVIERKTSAPKGNKAISDMELKELKSINGRNNFQETAFFFPNLRTDKKGTIEFEFESPEALTRWNFRMLAHTPLAKYGTFSAETLTQKELSIISNAPRFVREGDSLQFTAKIVNLTNKQIKGVALLELTNPMTGSSIDKQLQHNKTTQEFLIDSNGNNLLSWKITIPKNLSAIQYKIVAKAGNYTDGEEKIIPVLSNRMLVTESIPIWVRPKESKSYTLNNFDLASNTKKAHAITLEYTSNPAWIAIKSLPYLMEFPHACSEQTFSRIYANTIATYIINSQPKIKEVFDSWVAKGTLKSPLDTNQELKNILISESPWLKQARSETEQKQRLAALFDLKKTALSNKKETDRLRQLQKSNGGFPWFKGGKANPYITRHILIGFGHLEKLGITNKQTKTDNIVKNAIRFLDADLISNYEEYLNKNKEATNFYKQIQLLHFAYARSFYKNRFPLKGKVKDIITKALAFQKTDWQSKPIYTKGLLALTLHRFEESSITQNILTALIESAVNSKENGMYWKENINSWRWYQSSISTQALLIEAFLETKQPKKYIEELKIFLLKNKRINRWETTIETANASYALLLQGKDWLSLKDDTVIKVGGDEIATKKLSETQKERGTGYFKTHWSSDEITLKHKKINVTNKGKVTGYGGYYWQYFENLDNIKIDDKMPLSINKELYKKVVTNNGTELTRITKSKVLQVGDKVTVRLLIKSDNNIEFVHLKDARAGGFEPVNVISGYQYKELRFYQSTKDVATHFFIDRLPKGNHVLEYDVIANQKGSFSNGITQLQCMYAPEFSSHSAGQRVEIKE